MAWIYGHAGSGKSALLNSIAENLENAGIHFTCFLCKRDDPELSNVHRILTTISYIFTEFYGDYRGSISDLVSRPSGRSILTGNVRKQCELLFGKTYELISPEGAKRPGVHVILIDAFDECRNHRDGRKTIDERCALLELLLEFANKIPWIKVLITSRPEPDIVDVFTQGASAVNCIDINNMKWKTSADIRLFVEARSARLKLGLSPDEIDRFQAKAAGLFIWCTTVFQFIKESNEGKRQLVASILEEQPPNSEDNPHAPLYLLYRRVVDSAVSRARDRKMMEFVLSIIFIAATRRPLSSSAIADLLYPNEEEEEGRKGRREWVENIISSLLSILYVEEGTKAVRACHLSVLDFIGGMMSGGFATLTINAGDNAVPRFTFGVKEAHIRVFEGCFAIMDRDLRFNVCELQDSFWLNKEVLDLPIRISNHIAEPLQYATVFWLSHLEDPDDDMGETAVKVHEFMSSPKTLFWVEALSLMNAVDRGIVALQDCARFFAVRPSSRDFVRLLTTSRAIGVSWR